jgi:L-alanine-DL-glutamate epimerase-like enolase superfamily enzyme
MSTGQARTGGAPLVERIEARIVNVPLDAPVLVWGRPIASRAYLVVRVHAGPYRGTGIGLARGLPLVAAVSDIVAPHVLGTRLDAHGSAWDAVVADGAMIGYEGVVARAMAAVDIALWDGCSRWLEAPVWRLLGGRRDAVPAVAIAGYYTDDPIRRMRIDAAAVLQEGFRAVKVPVGLDLELDVARLAALREVVGPGFTVGVDAGAAYRTPKEALAAIGRLSEFDLAFVEDPLPSCDTRGASEIAGVTSIPIALGESETSLERLHELAGAGSLRGVDILRADATVAWGISGYLRATALALTARRPVYPHYFPDVHGALVGGLGGSWVEDVPVACDTTGLARIRRSPSPMREGVWQLDDEPGVGLNLDDAAIEALATGPVATVAR